MYFYIDESGHTGTNIFDPHQPILAYGVLSSSLNIDILAEDEFKRLRQALGVDRIHAAELGNKGLSTIAAQLVALQKELKVRFDLYRVNKADHAIISFFDQVFDQGLNPAVTWTGYWTPLRYVLLLKVVHLFDEGIAKQAWKARIELNDARSETLLKEVIQTLLSRIHQLPDKRSQVLISDALNWAMAHPKEINYNTSSKSDVLQVSPNLIGFQSVMMGIASRIKLNNKKATRIVVDQQMEFNNAQSVLASFYASAKGVQASMGPGLPRIDHSGMPNIPLTFLSSKTSSGLEFVDVHLWTFKRILEKKFVSPNLFPLFQSQINKGKTDEFSLRAIEKRWTKWFTQLPEPTDEAKMKAAELLEVDESRRLASMRDG